MFILAASIMFSTAIFFLFIPTAIAIFASNFDTFRVADFGLHNHTALTNLFHNSFWDWRRIFHKITICCFITGMTCVKAARTVLTNFVKFSIFHINNGVDNYKLSANITDSGWSYMLWTKINIWVYVHSVQRTTKILSV